MPEYEVAKFDDLKDGEMKDVTTPVGKALLSRVDGSYFATSPLCPHAKAPLSKGVLSGDGRVMCPWHGACFSVQTGDIEDGPSLDGLHSFKVIVKSKKVYIVAEDVEFKVGRKVAVCKKRNANSSDTTIIIGGGAGGVVSAETLRSRGYEGKIVVLSGENYLPIDRTKLSKSLKIDASKIALRAELDWKKLDIDITLGAKVINVTPTEKTITLGNGSTLKYDNLIVATGGEPRVLPFPGHDLKNIFVMRKIEDSKKIEEAIAALDGKKPNVVIVGSSFIGMEAASILAKSSNVTVIGMEKVPFERVLGPIIGQAMAKLNQFNGVTLEMEQFVQYYKPSAVDIECIGSVVLKSGKEIKCDFVILGAGVIPATEFLKSSGIPIDKDCGISVNSSMQVDSFEDVYFVGDIARYPYHITGENLRIEHWNVAQNQGMHAALCIIAKDVDQPLPKFEKIPYFWTVQYGKSLRYVGHASSFDEVIIQGSTEMDDTGAGLSFVAFYCREDQVLAVCSLARDPAVSHAAELLRLGRMPSGKEIKTQNIDILSIRLDKLTTEEFDKSAKSQFLNICSLTKNYGTGFIFSVGLLLVAYLLNK